MKKDDTKFDPGRPGMPDVAGVPDEPDMNDPSVVLSLLEADQVVAAKQQTHFGRQNLSTKVRALLWGLRIYVVVMLAIVLISVFRAVRSAH